jgi:REP element-mobilizing transposase RayT
MSDYYRRKLPHWHPKGQMFFITFRLANSLPRHIIQALKEEREHERQRVLSAFHGAQQKDELYKLDKKVFGQYDKWLDQCMEESPRWLAEEQVASIVAGELYALNGKRYRMVAFCIMPNHCHIVIDTFGYIFAPAHNGVTAPYPLADTLKILKGRTARFCNQALGRNGAFWHHESYDHLVREQQEYERIVWYTINNPVKAGLAQSWDDWKFTFLSQEA